MILLGFNTSFLMLERKSSQEKVKNLQQELQIAREKLFDELGNTHATNTWNYLRQENALLHRNLKLTEKRKLEKTIPVSTSDPPTISPDTSHPKDTQRFAILIK